MGNYVPGAGHHQADRLKPHDESRLVMRYETLPTAAMSAIDDPNLRLAVQSLDALISKVLEEKALAGQQSRPTGKAAEEQVRQDTDLASAFASLAQVLGGQRETAASSEPSKAPLSSTVSSAPLYKCPMDSNRHQESVAACKLNYKNLFPRPSSAEASSVEALFGNVLAAYQMEESNAGTGPLPTANQRRCSFVNVNEILGSGTGGVGGGSASAPDTIRINLPEILDQQDEITILRLLIKLLSTKVTRLNDDKRRLLGNIAVLSDINAEMAAIIERGIQK